MHFPAKCNSVRIAIQWFHIKHYLDYQYTKFQPYTFRVQKMCVFARYATLVPRLQPDPGEKFWSRWASSSLLAVLVQSFTDYFALNDPFKIANSTVGYALRRVTPRRRDVTRRKVYPTSTYPD